MNLISLPRNPLKGSVVLPGDKSISHRAALFASLAYGESCIQNFLLSGVTRVMLEALKNLGVEYHLTGKTLIVQGRGLGSFQPPAGELNCGNSATTLRLLAGALAGSGQAAVLDGSAGLRKRPMNRIVTPLHEMGVHIQSQDGCAPILIEPTELPLKGIQYTLPVASAQVKTCLLLAALSADRPTVLLEPELSRDHSERMLRSMGLHVASEVILSEEGQQLYQTTILPPDHPLGLKPLNMKLPGDFSTAAFLIVAALITPGSCITLRQVGLNSTRTGLLDVLIAMDAEIAIGNQSTQNGEPVGDITVKHSQLRGVQVAGDQIVRMIDEFPAFAAAAAFAEGASIVTDAGELRNKESDRISALCEEMRRLGVDIQEQADGFEIRGGRLINGGLAHSHGDHRLAMSLSLIGMAASQPVTVAEAEIISESFPEFSQTLQGLGGRLVLES
jgi:3-phosphoshikimate 1-carboxyvinyltransferase